MYFAGHLWRKVFDLELNRSSYWVLRQVELLLASKVASLSIYQASSDFISLRGIIAYG